MPGNKLAVILMGAPGAGKGTQGELLSDKLNLYYFETSRILERAFANAKKNDFVKIGGKKYYIKKQETLWKAGLLCDPQFVNFLTEKRIKELYRFGENLVLSGSPRTMGEARKLVPLLEKLYGKKNIKAVLIEVPPEETIYRNSHRRICSLMRHPILYSKETKNLKHCPLDGSKLLRRKGLDDPETIKVRLREYRERTLPVINFLKERGLKIRKVKGVGTVEQVFKRISKALQG
jgi:adenylate kinase